MPRKKKARQKRPEEQYAFLAIRVEQYDASVGTSVNHNVYAPQYAWNSHESDPLYPVNTRLRITGKSTYPEMRAGESYEVTIRGEDARSRRHNTTLEDAQAREETGSPKYREYRGGLIPVYDPPSGMGVIEKVRGEPRWTVWLSVAPQFISDALTLLGHGRDLYLSVHEYKAQRARWVRSLTIQTTDPAEE